MENITTTTTTTHCRVVLQLLYLLIGLIFILHCSLAVAETNGQGTSTLKTYIVFVEKPPKNAAGLSRQSADLNDWYKSFLPKAITTSSNHQHPRMVRTYKNVVTGFAARLTEEEVKAMAKMEGFLSAHVENKFPLHTTHTPKFLGLSEGAGFWNESNYGKGVIIGVLDTGISPEHISLSDEGMPPPPAKWKGICDFNAGVCNNKLIGARNFLTGDNLQPKDQEGHGTHTATTAAGGFVKDADAFGDANGTAVGMAPLAHLAIYKVCDEYGCLENDMLAAMDAAVEDGVDVLSLSLGAGSLPYYEDGIAVGAFRAMQKGIFVSCSAGNEGPDGSTLSNEAPWILTVGASTIDRAIRATAKLGNGDEYDGESLFQPQDFNSTSLLPLVYAGSSTANPMSRYCAAGSLQNVDVKGKLVLCESGGNDVYTLDKGDEVKRAGGAGMILMNQEKEGFSILADPHAVPATRVSYDAGTKIKAYINSITQPVATILFKGTVFGDSYAPAVTYFSSRGPSKVSPGILKPDIIGPGVNILAAWPFPVDNTNSKQPFNIISGTSMSCPHLSGIAALLKSSHPNWSPAAIKSAIMTTADVVNHDDKPIVDEQLSPADIFATGAGHVNPSKANHPGLVYDLEPEDYVPYLCGLNYTDSQIRLITQGSVSCSGVKTIPEAQLNYPSFSVDLGTEKLSYTRRVTNVGQASSTYNVEISAPPGIELSVTPETLVFTDINQKATYTVEFIPHGDGKTYGKHYSQGYIRWVSGNYSVRSPVSVQITSYSDSSYTTKVSLYVHIFSLFIIIVGLLS